MRTPTKSLAVRVPDDYLKLVKSFPLRTLRTTEEHTEALKVLTRLIGRPDGRLSVGEQDYAQVLGKLIDDYGNRKDKFVSQKLAPLDILRYLLDENQMSASDLGKILGNKTAASLVLSGKRELSKNHIRKLAARFKVDPGLFL